MAAHFGPWIEGAPDSNGMADLLQPQLHSQITLRIPENYYTGSPELPPALLLAMQFLLHEQVPFRLFYNFTQIEPRLGFSCSTRFVSNQAVWLVFLTIRSISEKVHLHHVLKSCLLGTEFGWAAILHKDFIQVIVDESALEKSVSMVAFTLNISRAYVPLYFVILLWSGTHFSSPDAFLLRETCGCDGGRGLSMLGDFIPKVGEPNGIEKTLAQIRVKKQSFGGRKITICPSMKVVGTWESSWKHFFSPFSFRAAHVNWTSAFVGLFDSFIGQHNFTFDLDLCSGAEEISPSEAVILMISSFACVSPTQLCNVPPLSLLRFEHFSTVFFTKSGSAQAFRLPSLLAPISDILTAVLLILASICLGVIMLHANKSRDICRAFLQTFSGLVGKSVSTIKNPRSWLFYSIWLLLTGAISMIYTNILQSYVVVPQVRYSGISLENMLEQDYTFQSGDWKWIKAISTDENYKAIGSKSITENFLSERVSKRDKYFTLPPPRLNEFISHYSEASKRVIVEAALETEVYRLTSKATGWDMIVGTEQLFTIPFWWYFGRIERASLLAKTAENLKEMGFLDYFPQLSQSKFRKGLAASVGISTVDRGMFEWATVSLEDGLIRESFVLFLYGIAIAFAGFLLENLTRIVKLVPNLNSKSLRL